MEPWMKVCMYVSVYAILRELRPIDPFYVEYVTSLSEKYTDQIVSPLKCKLFKLYVFSNVYLQKFYNFHRY